MDHVQPLTVDLDEAELEQLTALAEHEHRSPRELATEAVRARIARHLAYLAAIDESLQAAAEGCTTSDEEFTARRAQQRRAYLTDRGL